MPTFYLIIAIALLQACSSSHYQPREGDLLFQLASSTDFSQAIADATAQRDSLKFDHVGIVASDSLGNPYIIEATSRGGVKRTAWQDFLADAPDINGKPGVVAMRLTEPFDSKAAIRRALSHIGEEYDWTFMPDNGRTYCSELVYESYLHADGSHIFTAQPMNFRDKDGNMPQFWTDLFGKLGMQIPEGVPGTNPNDMSKEASLREAHRFF